ncbi:MAG: hypothetical protein ACRDTR_11830 [Rubrobacter sp.]
MITSTQNRAKTDKLLALAVLLAALAASLMLAAKSAHASTTFTVTNTNDSGAGSLRQAILDANATSGADVINFNIPGSGVQTIAPTTKLPQITEAVSINGYTQPGASANTKAVGNDAILKVELSGASASGADGLFITASNSTVKGLVINRWGNAGVYIYGTGATGNKVVGNYLGTDTSGTKDLGNGRHGVNVYDSASNNIVGGAAAAVRNVISGNQYGVFISDDGATGNRVLQNVISSNEYAGVALYSDTATSNRILSNSIFSNGDLGIDLNDDGPTANDPGDTDTGANDLQNKPILSSAKKGATGTTTVRGTLNSIPNKTFTVQFFTNPEGTDEGKTLLGSKSVTTNVTGNVSFTFSTKKAIRLGQNITATATNTSTGDNSEFSAPRYVVAQ